MSFLALLLNSCFLKQDRTTTVYGTITDERGQPVDSILVLAKGREWSKETTLDQTFSNRSGEYELLVDVPKKFDGVDVVIPFGSLTNPKFQSLYKDFRVTKDGQPTNNCCIAQIGEKTRYDFQLIAR
ncbi:hypothetical protein [Dyadobacter sp. Leaf189]|uniref:hypothetical protein n=1 Tax=Dyadobacter sp. Leaf189 TaxID=1736295 RepID=UPI0006FB2E7A|nr:hypothetical protein [Dyadobacter sp. Leaf189]KQS31068.1 hypothetical protein ASG33_11970 [Dyadobacter sp. Leaf189]